MKVVWGASMRLTQTRANWGTEPITKEEGKRENREGPPVQLHTRTHTHNCSAGWKEEKIIEREERN